MVLVQRSDERCENFKKNKIVKTLLAETNIVEEDARKVARAVERQVKKYEGEVISSATIREIVDSQLFSRGELEEAKKHQRIGVPASRVMELIKQGSRDNSNLYHTPETIHKVICDETMKMYALEHFFPPEISRAHVKGDIHISDLDYAVDRPLNCLIHDLRYVIKHGLKVDGSGRFCTSAGPARRLMTLVNHSGQALQASQTNMAGGQSMALWNVFFAPFVTNMNYEDIKRDIQAMVFQFGMSFVSRGSQPIFSSVNTEFTVPKFLRDEEAWGPDGKRVGTYGDFEDETRLINRAFTEIMLDGDFQGRPHRFPNAVWVLRPEMMTKEFEEDLLAVHEVSSKHSLPYFLNLLPDDGIENAGVLGCRSRLNDNWKGEYDTDVFTGNATYNTINLNRVALESKDEDEFFDNLEDKFSMIREVSYIRLNHARKCLNEYNLMPFLKQENGSDKYYNLDDATLAIGYCGLNEALVNLGFEGGILNQEGDDYGIKVLKRFNEVCSEYRAEDNYRWSVIATPMETGAGKFAELDLKYYKDAFVQGPKEAPYLTNSSHAPVDANITLGEKVEIESKYHPLSLGGNILNLFIGEAYPDPQGLLNFTKKIAQTDTGFFAYTGVHNHCYTCGINSRGLVDKCNHCSSTNMITQSRITGYMSTISQDSQTGPGWNRNKVSELYDRKHHEF